MELYYQPHQSRRREAAFIDAINKKLLPIAIVKKNYPLPAELENTPLITSDVLSWITSSGLKEKRKGELLDMAKGWPDELLVSKSIKRISCDIVLICNNHPYYIEFHEEQHRTLSVTRPKKIYSVSGEPIIVPRYVQRLLRDLWRIKYLKPFTIVWADWFEVTGTVPPLNHGVNEYALPGAFRFTSTTP